MNVELSLIIPVYNAESFILNTLVGLTEWKDGLDFLVQIILVDDGSDDLTLTIIKHYIEKKDPSIELLSYQSNQGKGYAVKKGMLMAKGKYRIFTDADIPYGFGVFNTILYYLEFKEFDVCIGNRKSAQSKYFIKMSLLRKFTSKIFTSIISRYVVTGVNDTQCGLKGFKGDIADTLFTEAQIKGFAFDVELLYLSYKFEYDIKRIPVSFEGNNITTVNLAYDSVNMLWDIFCLPFRYHFIKRSQ